MPSKRFWRYTLIKIWLFWVKKFFQKILIFFKFFWEYYNWFGYRSFPEYVQFFTSATVASSPNRERKIEAKKEVRKLWAPENQFSTITSGQKVFICDFRHLNNYRCDISRGFGWLMDVPTNFCHTHHGSLIWDMLNTMQKTALL